jgi:hypothetical protein
MYHHTQTGKWIIFIFGILAIALLVMGFLHPTTYPAFVVAIGILAALLLFGSLTVVGDNEQLSFYFGIGAIKKKFKYGDLQSIRKVKNKWYWGWGVRWFGRGWLYNVSGLDAVELIFKYGKVLRIGTNDPDALLRFVEARLKG